MKMKNNDSQSKLMGHVLLTKAKRISFIAELRIQS